MIIILIRKHLQDSECIKRCTLMFIKIIVIILMIILTNLITILINKLTLMSAGPATLA